LLALVQVAAFWAVNAANSSNARAKVEEELNVGQRVFARQLQQARRALRLRAIGAPVDVCRACSVRA
jgi:hypothetical protein